MKKKLKKFLKSETTKRIFDFLLSAIFLCLLLPLFIIIAILIKIDSKGDIFYIAGRVGLNGKKFKMYKFRTFLDDANKHSTAFSAPTNDPRITKLGKKLKKYCLNELPQLINILKGEMSFVGPRPEVEYYIKKLKNEEKKILTLKPGLTDLASIKFINEGEILEKSRYTNKDVAYERLIRPKKIKLQLRYIKERSLWLDIKIMIGTIVKILLKNGK